MTIFIIVYYKIMLPNESDSLMNDFFSVQAFRYVAGKFFTDLGAKPESF